MDPEVDKWTALQDKVRVDFRLDPLQVALVLYPHDAHQNHIGDYPYFVADSECLEHVLQRISHDA